MSGVAEEVLLARAYLMRVAEPPAPRLGHLVRLLGAVEAAERLIGHPLFQLANPNRARAVIGGLATGNQRAFNRADGAGYRWVADQLVALAHDPQTSGGLLAAVDESCLTEVEAALTRSGVQHWRIGHVEAGEPGVSLA